MGVKLRQRVEKAIVRRIVNDAIKAGYYLDVDDGEELTVRGSADRKAIMAALMTTDEDMLVLHFQGRREGWVKLVYGNDGWDVVNDYTTNLEPIMAGANKLAEKLETILS